MIGNAMSRLIFNRSGQYLSPHRSRTLTKEYLSIYGRDRNYATYRFADWAALITSVVWFLSSLIWFK